MTAAACAALTVAVVTAPSLSHAAEAGNTALLSPPDFGPGAIADAPLPSVLGAVDVDRYRRIFSAQEDGDWKSADTLIRSLDSKLLMGHVLFQRYMHPTAYRSSYQELRDWLDSYADHPGADRIHDLAMTRRPKGAAGPKDPAGQGLTGHGAAHVKPATKVHSSDRVRSAATVREIEQLQRDIRRKIRDGHPTGAARILDGARAKRLLDKVERGQAAASIAHAYFIFGADDKAITFAERAVADAGDYAATAHWAGGLAAWRKGDPDLAASHFERLARVKSVTGWLRSAGAYWASRAHLKQRRPRQATLWLAQAATHTSTFYGLLARRALGAEFPIDWKLPLVTSDVIDGIKATKAGRRGFALLQIGDTWRAELEFRRAYKSIDPKFRAGLMTIAERNDMPSLAMRIGGILRDAGHRPYYAALFPLPAWGDQIKAIDDLALVLAVVRQESQFNKRAKSAAGARGLMQLMPRTAAYVGEDADLKGRERHTLFDPEINLTLGQEYLNYLLNNRDVDSDLFAMLVAYNAGPGNLRKWRRKVDFNDDPLLFVESIPSRETRIFVERVLTNLWMYRLRLGQPSPTLDKVASGDWPRYSLDAVLGRGEIEKAEFGNARN